MPAEKHALLSASGAERWINCTPSARLTEHMPDTMSEYAAEGKLAHAMAELHLRHKYVCPLGQRKFQNALKKLKDNGYYRNDMDGYISEYLDYIDSITRDCATTPHIEIETRVCFDAYVPEGYGTCDVLIISDGTLHVIDLKYGKGVPVEAENNPQMMLYALGALTKHDVLGDITGVALTIAQPRLNAWPEREISADDLRAWGRSIKPIAAMAWAGHGEYKPGEWCRWCKAKHRCAARSDAQVLAGIPPVNMDLISNEEIARRIAIITPYVDVLNDLKAFALSECLAGRSVPGYKAVEGRSNRVFTDVSAAFGAAVRAGYDEAALYRREPITLTAAEKLMGKDFNRLLGEYVYKPQGKPTLVTEGDARGAVTTAVSVEKAFSEPYEPIPLF